MSTRDFKLKIRNQILQVQSARVINESEIAVRCPLCGDSKKDPNKARFYIKINLNADEPILFHCFNCESSGILTPSILRSFRINDLQINSSLLSYNKEATKKLYKSLGIKNNDFDFIVPVPKQDEKTMKKLNYINNRLGVNLSIEEWVNLKTVFNLGDFLRTNDIPNITVKKERALCLHQEYVGFLTAKNEFINFRDITGKNKRYDKYSIFKNLDNTRKFYTIPNSIDLLTTDTITINIAEGVFDILGIYFHMFDKEIKNTVYAAVCGSGYISVIKYFIQMGLFGNVDVNIFSDSDKTPSFYESMKEELKDWVNKFTLYYNEKGHDYGLTKDKISLVKKKI